MRGPRRADFARWGASATVEDERIAEGRVGLVLHRAPFGVRREEFAERARLPFAWMAAVVEPVVEEEHRAVLKDRSDGGERVARRFVEIAVEMREGDLPMHRRKRRGQRLLEG